MAFLFLVRVCVDCQDANGCGKADRTALIAGKSLVKPGILFCFIKSSFLKNYLQIMAHCLFFFLNSSQLPLALENTVDYLFIVFLYNCII